MLRAFTPNKVEQRSYPQVFSHNFYIYGEVSSDTNDYIELIHTLDTAEENDVVNIYLNTPGGSLETTISIVHAMYRTKGTIVTHADGQVASAGTLIFFAGHTYCVYPYSHMMLHDGGSYMGGKFNENLKNAQATVELVTKICYDLYQPTFTKEEVDSILSGVDKYCSSEELLERVKGDDQDIIEEPNKELELDDTVIIDWESESDIHSKIGKVIDINSEFVTIEIDDNSYDITRDKLITMKEVKGR